MKVCRRLSMAHRQSWVPDRALKQSWEDRGATFCQNSLTKILDYRICLQHSIRKPKVNKSMQKAKSTKRSYGWRTASEMTLRSNRWYFRPQMSIWWGSLIISGATMSLGLVDLQVVCCLAEKAGSRPPIKRCQWHRCRAAHRRANNFLSWETSFWLQPSLTPIQIIETIQIRLRRKMTHLNFSN